MRTLNPPFRHNYAMFRLWGEIILQYKNDKPGDKIVIGSYDPKMEWKYVDVACPRGKAMHDKMCELSKQPVVVSRKRKREELSDDENDYCDGTLATNFKCLNVREKRSKKAKEMKKELESLESEDCKRRKSKSKKTTIKRERVKKSKSCKSEIECTTTSVPIAGADSEAQDASNDMLTVSCKEETENTTTAVLIAGVTSEAQNEMLITPDPVEPGMVLVKEEPMEPVCKPFSAWSINSEPSKSSSNHGSMSNSSNAFKTKISHIVSSDSEEMVLVKQSTLAVEQKQPPQHVLEEPSEPARQPIRLTPRKSAFSAYYPINNQQ
jgi:hypothetical protein